MSVFSQTQKGNEVDVPYIYAKKHRKTQENAQLWNMLFRAFEKGPAGVFELF